MRAQRDFWLDLLCPQAHFPNVKTVMGHVKQFAGEWWKDRIEPIGLSTTFHFWKTPPLSVSLQNTDVAKECWNDPLAPVLPWKG